MNHEVIDAGAWTRLDEISLEELLERSGLTEATLQALIEVGSLAPVSSVAGATLFTSYHVIIAARARRLQEDFDLDAHAVSIVMRYVERVQALQAEIDRLRARMPGGA